jgi:hypothetical protein
MADQTVDKQLETIKRLHGEADDSTKNFINAILDFTICAILKERTYEIANLMKSATQKMI